MTQPIKPVSRKLADEYLTNIKVEHFPFIEILATYKHLCEKQHEALVVAEYALRPTALELEHKASKDYTEYDCVEEAIALHNQLIGE
jgi:hypothetical protein